MESKRDHITEWAIIALLVIGIGVAAWRFVPEFGKVREGSREKSVMNNLRQIASAGQSYILEEGVPMVTYEQLVGDYFSHITPVDDETYDGLVIREAGGTVSVVTKKYGRVVYTY